MIFLIYIRNLIFLTSKCVACSKKAQFLGSRRFFPWLLVVCWGLISVQVQAQRKPSIGLTVGASSLSANNGFMFDFELAPPHRDAGFTAGLTAFYPLDKDLHVTCGAQANFDLSHFHVTLGPEEEIVTAYFHYGYFHVPILLNHAPMHKSRRFFVVKEFFGFAFNFGNMLSDVRTTEFPNQNAVGTTQMIQNWQINPEFIIGVGLISRQLKVGKLHYGFSLHMDLLRNQRFIASIRDFDTNAFVTVEQELRGIKGQFSMTYYPQIKLKKKGCYKWGR